MSAALLLILSTLGANAQAVSDDPRTTPGQSLVPKTAPPEIPSSTAPADAPAGGAATTDSRATDSLARDAIRVPAFGTTEPTTPTLARQTQPRKRPRVVVRRVEMVDLPPPHDAGPLYYRFGYGYGPGIRLYRW